MKQSASTWLRNLTAAVITGGSTAALASLGVTAAGSAGMQVAALDTKQLGILFASGAVVGLLAYLKQSPIPPE